MTQAGLLRELQRGESYLLPAVIKAAIFQDLAPCGPYTNRRFGEAYHLRDQSQKSAEKETSLPPGDIQMATC
jgi:hypothetical protein